MAQEEVVADNDISTKGMMIGEGHIEKNRMELLNFDYVTLGFTSIAH